MDRRDFLGLLAAFTVDPEKLLWIPGEKKIFIPSGKKYSNYEDILAIELERLFLPHQWFIPMRHKVIILFERDDTFYKVLTTGKGRR